jgi:hypothetical protein
MRFRHGGQKLPTKYVRTPVSGGRGTVEHHWNTGDADLFLVVRRGLKPAEAAPTTVAGV